MASPSAPHRGPGTAGAASHRLGTLPPYRFVIPPWGHSPWYRDGVAEHWGHSPRRPSRQRRRTLGTLPTAAGPGDTPLPGFRRPVGFPGTPPASPTSSEPVHRARFPRSRVHHSVGIPLGTLPMSCLGDTPHELLTVFRRERRQEHRAASPWGSAGVNGPPGGRGKAARFSRRRSGEAGVSPSSCP